MMGSKILVLFAGHTYVTGAGQKKLDVLARTGCVDVALLVPKVWRARDWERTFELERPYKTIETFAAAVVFNGRAGAYFYHPYSIVRAIRSFRPDILQVEQEVFSLSAFEVAVLAKLYRRPVVFFGWENLDRPLSFVRRITRSIVLRSAQAVICGNGDGQDLVRKWGYGGRTIVMPQLGVDTEWFRPRAARDAQRTFTLGFAGRLVYEKGVDLVIHALRLLRDKGYRSQFIICGTGPLRETLQKQVAEFGLQDSVIWKDPVRHREVPTVMAEFDILLLPSRTVSWWKEQFGHVLIEAMAMGIPVVGSDSGEIPNVIGRRDLIFPENNFRALAEIAERLMTTPAWWQEISQYGMDRVHRHYTHEQIAQQLVGLYRTILQDSRCEM